MKAVLLHPCYFGPISEFVAIAKTESVIFENEDNYQKQTYRSRMYIYGANGKLSLNIPIKHTGDKSQHQKYKNVRIENEFGWQKQHWKSLQTAYRTSPFFEFYEDDLAPLYHRKPSLGYGAKDVENILFSRHGVHRGAHFGGAAHGTGTENAPGAAAADGAGK